MKPQKQPAKEIWDTNPDDALRVSILNTDVCEGRSVSKWNIDKTYVDKSHNSKPTTDQADSAGEIFDALSESILREDVPAPSQEIEGDKKQIETHLKLIEGSSNLDKPSKMASHIGIYSGSNDYYHQLMGTLQKDYTESQFIRCTEGTVDGASLDLAKISALIINLSEDDENPIADQLLELSSDIPTLFLFDTALTSTCADKLECFMQENGRSKNS